MATFRKNTEKIQKMRNEQKIETDAKDFLKFRIQKLFSGMTK